MARCHRVRVIVCLVMAASSLGAPRLASAAPANDDLATATLIEQGHHSETITTEGAMSEPGEDHPCGMSDATIWFQYRAPVEGVVRIETRDADFDTVIAVWYGLPDATSHGDLEFVPACVDDPESSGATLEISDQEFGYIQIGGRRGAPLALLPDFTAGTAILDIDLTPLEDTLPTGAISGVLTGPDGEAASGILANAYLIEEGVNVGYHPAVSNDRGGYRFRHLLDGTYKIEFFTGDDFIGEYYDDHTSYDEAALVRVENGAETTGIDAVLERAGHITGRVTDLDSRPISNDECVWAVGHSRWPYDTRPQADGTYDIGGLPPGEHIVVFDDDCDDLLWDEQYELWDMNLWIGEYYNDAQRYQDATPVVVRAGEVTSGIDAQLAPRPRPDLVVEQLDVMPTVLEPAGVASLWHPTERLITVRFGNVGTAIAHPESRLVLRACPETEGASACELIASDRIRPRPGRHRTSVYQWDATGFVGGIMVLVELETLDDPQREDNTAAWYTRVGPVSAVGWNLCGVAPAPCIL